MRNKTLRYDLYNKVIDVCIGTKKELITHVKKYYKNKISSEVLEGLIELTSGDKYYGRSIGVPEMIDGNSYNIIYINIDMYPVYKKSLYSVLTHEIYHTVERIANKIGLSRKEDCAYLAGDIMENSLPLIKEAERRVIKLNNLD